MASMFRDNPGAASFRDPTDSTPRHYVRLLVAVARNADIVAGADEIIAMLRATIARSEGHSEPTRS